MSKIIEVRPYRIQKNKSILLKGENTMLGNRITNYIKSLIVITYSLASISCVSQRQDTLVEDNRTNIHTQENQRKISDFLSLSNNNSNLADNSSADKIISLTPTESKDIPLDSDSIEEKNEGLFEHQQASASNEGLFEHEQASASNEDVKLIYYVVAGDNLSQISKKLFGTSKRWKELAKQNDIKNPSKIFAGDMLYYYGNKNSLEIAKQNDLNVKTKSIVVKKGDSLSKISQIVLGNVKNWRVLWKQNPQIKNPDDLKIGTILEYKPIDNYVRKEEVFNKKSKHYESVEGMQTSLFSTPVDILDLSEL
ncbi:MAG: LysM peptidoglycan-binding domain-containing protein [Silvanigrellaceae bacterium]|nr:LysM peptidoglycan-binding domain-containing protein [Silvanigrellaceae bacterium]